jgi:hypothetical protein
MPANACRCWVLFPYLILLILLFSPTFWSFLSKERDYVFNEKGYEYMFGDYRLENTEDIIPGVSKKNKIDIGQMLVTNSSIIRFIISRIEHHDQKFSSISFSKSENNLDVYGIWHLLFP